MTIKIREITVNLNQHCRVKLTELGRMQWKKHWNEFGVEPQIVPPDGSLRLSLWEMANVFGPCLGNGMNVPFETEIIIEND